MDHKAKNLTLLFFVGYLLLMASLIYFAIHYKKDADLDKITHKQNEVAATFSEEFKAHEEKVKQKKIEEANKWKPSKSFIVTAISISSVLDIVVILLWVWHENKKQKGDATSSRKKWTNQKWFWNVVALGIIQPKNNRMVINWKNLLLFLIVMYFLKTLLFKYLEERSSAGPSMLVSILN